MTPVRAFLIFPKDKTALLDADPQVGRIAHAAFERVRDWLARETGQTFDLRFDIWRSEKTARELGAYVPDSPYPDIPHDDPCGQGLHWGTVLAELHKAAGVTTGIQSGGSVGRLLAIVVNGGGWAGAALTWRPDADHWLDAYSKGQQVGTDIGYTVLGDWQFTWAATRRADPCAVRQYGETFARDDFTKALGHECCHAFGIEVHTPVTYYPDPLNAEQKAQYLGRNKGFLRPVLAPMPPAGGPEPEVPVPPQGPKYRIAGELTGTVEGLP